MQVARVNTFISNHHFTMTPISMYVHPSFHLAWYIHSYVSLSIYSYLNRIGKSSSGYSATLQDGHTRQGSFTLHDGIMTAVSNFQPLFFHIKVRIISVRQGVKIWVSRHPHRATSGTKGPGEEIAIRRQASWAHHQIFDESNMRVRWHVRRGS